MDTPDGAADDDASSSPLTRTPPKDSPRFDLEIDVDDVTSATLPKDVDDAMERRYGPEIPAELAGDVKRAKVGVMEFAVALAKKHGPGPATFKMLQTADGTIQVSVHREATKKTPSIASATVLLPPEPPRPPAPEPAGPPPAVLPEKAKPGAPTPPQNARTGAPVPTPQAPSGARTGAPGAAPARPVPRR